ncbi:MAG: glycosyltransferase [Acidimicrobiales bacterium]
MPFFNHGMFVAEAIDSVRGQSYPVSEIVVVDDGSSEPQSIAVLSQLEHDGIVVHRQKNQGPSAARNAGVGLSSGDAILFLDSDDRLSDGQIEQSVMALANAPAEIGFAYPDLQFFGNERDLVVMPPYNFYLLLHRNFCAMGSLIDRSIFDCGHQFREDLVSGHEDWDFFVGMGKMGVFGVPVHGVPLQWRRWGFSRSDGVQESKGSFLEELRDLHPDLYNSRSLVEVKRQWSPALSVVGGSDVAAHLVAQTCDDFELVVLSEKDAAAGNAAPPVRGRWVAVVTQGEGSILADATFVERALRLIEHRAVPVALGLELEDGDRVGRRRDEPNRGRAIGAIVDGATYASWLDEATRNGEHLLDYLARRGEPARWLSCRRPAAVGGTRPKRVKTGNAERQRRSPPSLEATSQKDGDDQTTSRSGLAEQAAEIETSFRWSEIPPLYIPAGGLQRVPEPPRGCRDALTAITQRAWAQWAPSRTQRLDLVIDAHGRSLFETVSNDAPPATGTDRLTIGRIWARPFPGTACLYSNIDVLTHAHTYRVSEDQPTNRFELPIGYVATDDLPGAVDLREALDRAVHSSSGGRRVLDLPEIDTGGTTAYIERTRNHHQAWPGTVVRRMPGLSGSRSTTMQRTWPLYEVVLRNGAIRYTLSPDACVAQDVLRPVANPIARVTEQSSNGGLQPLHEVRFRATGGTGYVSRSELADSLDQLEPVRELGSVADERGFTVPLVRLHPISPDRALAGEPGHRLAIDWQQAVSSGYVPEGVIGFAREPDADRAPLYRWRSTTAGDRRLTLGEPPDGPPQMWQFEGTLGTAWRVGSYQLRLVDLWEMVRGDGAVSYSVEPWFDEERGFAAHRVVARIQAEGRPDAVPLFANGSADAALLVTNCRGEGKVFDGAFERVLGYVDPAFPPTSAKEQRGTVPDGLVDVDWVDGTGLALRGWLYRIQRPGTVGIQSDPLVDGPPRVVDDGEVPRPHSVIGYASLTLRPASQPVYALTCRVDDRRIISTALPSDGQWAIDGVACFLPGVPDMPHGDDGVIELSADTGRRRAIDNQRSTRWIDELHLRRPLGSSLTAGWVRRVPQRVRREGRRWATRLFRRFGFERGQG